MVVPLPDARSKEPMAEARRKGLRQGQTDASPPEASHAEPTERLQVVVWPPPVATAL
jgi:hypothetical protein